MICFPHFHFRFEKNFLFFLIELYTFRNILPTFHFTPKKVETYSKYKSYKAAGRKNDKRKIGNHINQFDETFCIFSFIFGWQFSIFHQKRENRNEKKYICGMNFIQQMKRHIQPHFNMPSVQCMSLCYRAVIV